jgi:hypothetical protein
LITTAAVPEYMGDCLRLGHDADISNQVLIRRNKMRPVTMTCVETPRDSAIMWDTPKLFSTRNSDFHRRIRAITRATGTLLACAYCGCRSAPALTNSASAHKTREKHNQSLSGPNDIAAPDLDLRLHSIANTFQTQCLLLPSRCLLQS